MRQYLLTLDTIDNLFLVYYKKQQTKIIIFQVLKRIFMDSENYFI